MIPFLDLAGLHASIRDELDVATNRVVATSAFINGREVADFERELAAAHQRSFAIGCASGTDALALSLRALGVGPGDEVVVPSMTFVATAEAIVHAGAIPVIADVDPVTLLLSPAGVAAVRSDRTRAVVPVHLYGHVVAEEHLREWRDDGLVVLEDAAQAHLGANRSCRIGDVGAAATLSFFPGKNLGAMGDAGAVLTDDEAVAERVRRLRDHGRCEKYVHSEVGFASRLDGLQAAILAVKLRHLSEWTEQRRALAARYREVLSGVSEVRLVPWCDGAVHHLLCIRVAASRRAALLTALRDQGIGCGIHYPVPLSRQPALAASERRCPEAERAADELVSLPIDPLMETSAVDVVCKAVLEHLD